MCRQQLSHFFLFLFFPDIPVYIQTEEKSDFADLTNIVFLSNEFQVQENYFKELNDHSLVVLDDFYLEDQKSPANQTFFVL